LKHQNKSSSKHKATNENPAPNQIYENQALASIDDTLEQPILTRSFIIPEQCGYGNYLETFVDENISFYNPENFQIKYQKTGFYELSGKYISETLPKDSESDKIYLSQNNIYFIRENYWASYFSAQDNTPCEYTIGLLADIPSKRQNDYDYFIVNTKVTLDPNYSYIKTELIERKVIKPIVLPSGKIFVLYSNEQEKVYQSDGKENIKLLHGELYIEQGTNYQSITIK
ncbi:hypothetical protein MJH12_19440, partial [bacterium]|nr:hypothetical protein [bacterium]